MDKRQQPYKSEHAQSLVEFAVGMVVLLVLVYVLPGYALSVVRSDSMKPVFAAGDMVVTVPPGSLLGREIAPGSIVTYDLGAERITHRVISIDNNDLVTKGDANEEPDPRPVAMSQVEGTYLFRIPYVGRLSVFVHTKPGWFLLIILPTCLLIGLIVKEIVKEALRADKPAKAVAREDKPLKPSGTE